MLFSPPLFSPPLFEAPAPLVLPPLPIFPVTRQDAGTPWTFTAPLKDPESTERHGMDWSGWLQEGDAIASCTVTVDRDTLLIDQVGHDDGIVSWRLRGGANGEDYILTCQITSTSGLIDERSVRYPVRQR